MERGNGWWAGPARAWGRGESEAIYCPFASPCPPSSDMLFKVTSLRGRALFFSLSKLSQQISHYSTLSHLFPMSFLFPVRLLFLLVVLACS
jgi:hypothetical protein